MSSSKTIRTLSPARAPAGLDELNRGTIGLMHTTARGDPVSRVTSLQAISPSTKTAAAIIFLTNPMKRTGYACPLRLPT
jgi:hypothetical protein